MTMNDEKFMQIEKDYIFFMDKKRKELKELLENSSELSDIERIYRLYNTIDNELETYIESNSI